MKQSNKEVELEVRDIALTGEGVARLGNETVFIPGAIAGETVAAALGPGRSPRRASLLRVIAASPERVAPPCPHAARCGGCDFMHLSPEARGRWHLERVRRALHGIPLPEVALHEPVPPLGYRGRARLQVTSNGRRAKVGYFGARSHELVAIDSCAVLDPRLAPAIAELAAILAPSRGKGEAHAALGRSATAPPLHSSTQQLSSSSTQQLSSSSTQQLSSSATELLSSLATELLIRPVARSYEINWIGDVAGETMRELERVIAGGAVAGARIWLDGAREPIVAGDPRPVIVGADGEALVVAPGGFAQASDAGGAAIARRVAELAAGADKAVELFAGSGTITVALARAVGSLTAVERDEAAVAALRENLRRRGLDVRVRHDDADAIALPRVDLVVLDPPRGGAAGAARHVAAARPRKVVYVSCNAATLARDLALLDGYRVASVDLYELFPQTSHVEVVASLVRA